ncbi:unnamed protein product [Brassica oleracea var. botrytis]
MDFSRDKPKPRSRYKPSRSLTCSRPDQPDLSSSSSRSRLAPARSRQTIKATTSPWMSLLLVKAPILMRNNELRPFGSTPLPEANKAAKKRKNPKNLTTSRMIDHTVMTVEDYIGDSKNKTKRLISTPPSFVLFFPYKNRFFIDFVGLFCKSERTRRRLRGDSSSSTSRASPRLAYHLFVPVTDLESCNGVSGKDLVSMSNLKPQPPTYNLGEQTLAALMGKGKQLAGTGLYSGRSVSATGVSLRLETGFTTGKKNVFFSLPKAEPEQRKSVTFDEQTIITGHQYQSWLQDASDILTREKKRKGLLRPSMYVKRLKLPPTQLFEEHVDGSYPSETTPRPDFRCIHHRSATSSQNAGRLGDTLAGKGLMSGTRASAENNSGDDVRSMPEPYDSGDYCSGSGSGTSVNPDIPITGSKKIMVHEDGIWSQFRSQKCAALNQAAYSSGKMVLKEGETDVFIDLESIRIDAASAVHLRRNIDEVLARDNCKSRNISVYALNTLSRSIRMLLLAGLGSLFIKDYHARRAICYECQYVQTRHQKTPLLELEMCVDIGRYSYALKRGGLLANPIMVITNDEDTIGQLAYDLQGLYEVKIIRTLPAGMHRVPMYRDLTEDELLRKRLARQRAQAWHQGQAGQRGQGGQRGQAGQRGQGRGYH